MRKGLKPLLIVAACCLAIWGYIAYKQPALYHSQSYVFGTLVDISIYGEPEERAKALTNHILQDFQHLHVQLHAWQPSTDNSANELGTLNAAFASGEEPIHISPRMAEILRDATKLSQQSNGLFNPSIGHLIGTWGFQRDEFGAMHIDKAHISNLVKANPRMSDIVIKNNTAYSKNPNVKLDLGGYAKGYALDQAADYLRKQRVHNALINIGGNIIALGQHGDTPWRVGIQHPRKPGAIATLELADGWAIGTSGDYQRYFMLDGKRYCHIIDPYTGYPVQHTQAVTVLIPPQAVHSTQAGTLSDVASKPIFIEPFAQKSTIAASLGIQHYMVIDQAAQAFVTPELQTKLTWLDADFKRHLHVQATAQH